MPAEQRRGLTTTNARRQSNQRASQVRAMRMAFVACCGFTCRSCLVQSELFAQEQVFGRQSGRGAQTQPQEMERINKQHAQWRGRL